MKHATLGILIMLCLALLCGACTTLNDGVLNTSIAFTTPTNLVCTVTNVPCLVSTNGTLIPLLTDEQWNMARVLLVRGTNSAWAVKEQAFRFEVKAK